MAGKHNADKNPTAKIIKEEKNPAKHKAGKNKKPNVDPKTGRIIG